MGHIPGRAVRNYDALTRDFNKCLPELILLNYPIPCSEREVKSEHGKNKHEGLGN